MDKIKAGWKFFLSYLRKDWIIEDYPLRYKTQKNFSENNKYCVQIINWWVLCGLGKTKAEAFQSLKDRFQAHVKVNGFAPRPGTKVPIKFASSQMVDQYYDITHDFLQKILGFSNTGGIFVSDESSLYDFLIAGNLDNYFKKIKDTYQVDVSAVKDGKISSIT